MTHQMFWRTDAPVTAELYARQKDRLDRLHETLGSLEKEGVYVKEITLYVDGVEWELTHIGDRDFGAP